MEVPFIAHLDGQGAFLRHVDARAAAVEGCTCTPMSRPGIPGLAVKVIPNTYCHSDDCVLLADQTP